MHATNFGLTWPGLGNATNSDIRVAHLYRHHSHTSAALDDAEACFNGGGLGLERGAPEERMQAGYDGIIVISLQMCGIKSTGRAKNGKTKIMGRRHSPPSPLHPLV